MPKALTTHLAARYQDPPEVPADLDTAPLTPLAARGSCRAFENKAVPLDVLRVLCATALAAPTKSDLQQRDIVIVQSPDLRQTLAALVDGQPWVAEAPTLLVFCGNNRRQRLLHDWHDIPFANDHADAVINATADAAIALGAFVTAAEAIGLGCCPISALRNQPAEVSKLLGLPNHVFPFAGLAVGYPTRPARIAKRLPLSVTCHVDRYDEADLQDRVAAYDADRAATHPYRTQRFTEQFGESDSYGWSEDKVRQYSAPERADFGAYLRHIGFTFDESP